ncbi:MFS transporter [Sphingomonas piscis]|uniref:MFS transporter n=1 Tax=Sphingomonas piscis TaxID=2714943 RepID=A0A6G7YS96_9SPHN|nr:NnrU family protein [Sphingomonas piscis]QIK79604.1 MFS transporter [Sphingomonas piscis]
MLLLILFAAAFVGSHFAMSHPLRSAMVERLGERGFQGVYSLISLIFFAGMIWAYRGLGRQEPVWSAGEWAWVSAEILMWFASVLLAGSFVRNPALPGAPMADRPAGVLRLTRHPMMWSFAIWAVVHAVVIATPKALVLDASMLLLALGGSVGQDAKKRRLIGERWHDWSAQTAFVPFARGIAYPGTVALVGGTLLYLLATWLHPLPVSIWRLVA